MPAAMLDLLLRLLPLTLVVIIVVVVFNRLRHASPSKATYAYLATVKSAMLRELSTVWRRPDYLVSDCVAAHHLLVRAGAGGAFSNRPPSIVPSAVLSLRRHYNMNSAPYGPFWRVIRRNLTSEVFHPSRLQGYAPARRRALSQLIADLDEQRVSSGVVLAAESMRTAMFGLVAAMCFGDGIGAGRLQAMADAQDDLVQCFIGLRVFATFPAVTGLIYRKRFNKLVTLRRQQEEMYLPLIDDRRGRRRLPGEPPAYVDTLIDLRVPDSHNASGGNARRRGRQRRLRDGELVGLCSEFLGAGTEPAAAALQWTMANLVKRQDVQDAVRREINAAVDADAEQVGEEVLGRLEHLNAVLMEALRLHPTVPMVLRQVMAEDHVVVDGRRVPPGTAVKFHLENLARNKTAWADPDKFRPERFLSGGEGEGVSLVAAAGSAGEIRMMPFGAGRRMCPGMGVAVLHLGYLVANLVREFEWTEAEGKLAVDLEAHLGFFTVMKRPLRAKLLRRREAERKC